jgi:hypothetical protein
MRDEYDFSQSVRSPYLKKLREKVDVRLEQDIVDHFKQLSEEIGIPSEVLINLYLRDCIRSDRKPHLEWI